MKQSSIIGIVLCLVAPWAAAQQLQLQVEVVPRIGAFNHLAWRIDKDSGQLGAAVRPPQNEPIDPAKWSPYSRKDYLQRIADRLKSGLRRLTPSTDETIADEWDMITTAESQSGYSHRRVALRVDQAPANAKCTFRLNKQVGTTNCRSGQWFNLATNNAVQAEVDIDPGDGTPVVTKQAMVPEDFLIVAMGDSFLSGQGNPDGPRKQSIDIAGCYADKDCVHGVTAGATWMDERCQRSAWSTPVQTGIRIAKALGKQRGAVTVVSFACSGAMVSDGINGPYAGQVEMDAFIKRNPNLGWYVGAPGGGAAPAASRLFAQRQALQRLMADQAAADRKDRIDVLLVDGGGNDAKFSALVIDLIAARLAGTQQAAYAGEFTNAFAQLNFSFEEFRKDVNGQRISQKLVFPYPDATRRPNGTGCGGAPFDIAAANALAKVFTGVLNWTRDANNALDATISDDEARFAGEMILAPLNSRVKDFASSISAVYFADAVPLLQGRGWCASGTKGDPFEPSGRWIRKVDESLQTQGDIYGAMHPTWEYHAAAADLASKFVQQAFALEPDLKVAPARESGNWVSPDVTVQAYPQPHKVCAAADKCLPGPATFKHAHGEVLPAVYEVIDTATLNHRWLKSPYAGRVVDAEQPTIDCTVVRGAVRLRCDSPVPISSASVRLEFTATDAHSGVASIQLATADGTVLDRASTATLATDSFKTLPDGPVRVVVSAIDKVGNPAAKPFEFNKDSAAPVIGDILAAAYAAPVGALLLHPLEHTSLKIKVTDAGTGPCELVVSPQLVLFLRVAPMSDCNNAGSNAAKSLDYQVALQPGPVAKGGSLEVMQLQTRDYAGNQGDAAGTRDFKVALLATPCRTRPGTNCALSAAQWLRPEAGAELAQSIAVANHVGAPAPDLKAEADALSRALAAAWANLYSGRLGATMHRKSFSAACKIDNSSAPLVETLANLTACSQSAANDVRQALLSLRLVPAI